MVRTRVGYAGGKMESPDYSHIGDHTETVQVDYDPNRINYDQLLEVFWKSHQPDRQSRSQQYKNVIFFHNNEQHEQAMASKTTLAGKLKKIIQTQIKPLNTFTDAEDYHQKYILKHHRLKKEIFRMYPNHQDIVGSTTAARLNGYAGGHGDKDQLARELKSLGLSEAGNQILTGLFKK